MTFGIMTTDAEFLTATLSVTMPQKRFEYWSFCKTNILVLIRKKIVQFLYCLHLLRCLSPHNSSFTSLLAWPSSLFSPCMGSTITNGREPRSFVGRVFNCKLGSFTDNAKNVAACKWPLLKLKTRPRFCRVSWSLSMPCRHWRTKSFYNNFSTFSANSSFRKSSSLARSRSYHQMGQNLFSSVIVPLVEK